MQRALACVSLVLCLVYPTHQAFAQSDDPPQEPESVDLFGFRRMQNDRLKISGLLVGAQAALGFENQARVAQATITFSGRVNSRVRYVISFNPVNETASKPACGEANYFFPNDPSLYIAGPIVPCDPEQGHKRVDTYNTFALDYINQQGPLREGYVDWRVSDRVSARLGRFIVPLGFAPPELGSWTSKDLTRIQRLNAEAHFGVMVGYAQTRPGTSAPPWFEVAALGVLGDGNREEDYDWFYFADTSLDSNSALTAIVSARLRPHRNVDVRTSYKKGFTGSKVERLPSYWASKRNDDAFVAGTKVQVHSHAWLFGEYARYVWGPTASSAELLGADPAAIVKPGYYIGGTYEVPITTALKVGGTLTREELSRDDSLVKYLQAAGLYHVEMGKKDRGTVIRVYVDVARLVTFGAFWADVSNPYPWISGSWPVAGPAAFTGRSPDRYGFTVLVRTP
jgi:hypothetical protein